MPRKVIIDCDPGIDDALALVIALFDPRLEVIAVTAVAGNVDADQASRNVQSIIEQLDPPRFPRLGAASPPDSSCGVDGRHIHGEDGLANLGLNVSRLHHQHASEKILCDEIRAASEQVTVLCLGPLTNLARALQRDPGIASHIGRLVIAGGSVHSGGDVTAAAEFNMYFDPESAQAVFRAPITKTIVPLDLGRQLAFNVGFVNVLPREYTRAGRFLRRIVPHVFRMYHQRLGQEVIPLQALVAWLAVVHPEFFRMSDMEGDVEIRGELTTGATVFDRRRPAAARSNIEVALEVAVHDGHTAIAQALDLAGQAT
ncbi:MAG: nucleoside hydrolase [Pirellulales bacterium]